MGVPVTLSSVPAQTPYVQYVSGASQTVFPYPFEITQDSDLVCLINGVAQPTDGGYTLTGQGATGGGNLTFTLGQTAGTIITLYRNISIARITQLSQNGTFFASNFNNEYNRIYLIMQQLQQSLLPGGNQAYALMVPNSNNPAPTTLLTPASYANKYLSFDSNGNPTPAVLTSSGSLTAGIISTLLAAGASAAQRAQLAAALQDSGYRYLIHPAETAFGLTSAGLTFGFDPGDVRRYGFVGNNIADDTIPVQNAIGVWSNGGPVPFFPGNITFKTTAAITIPQGLYLYGNGATIKPTGSVNAFTLANSIVGIINFTIDLTATTGKGISAPAAIQQFLFQQLIIKCSSGAGVDLVDCYSGIFDKVNPQSGSGYGIRIRSTIASVPTNSIWLLNCGAFGFTGTTSPWSIEGAAGIYMMNVDWQNNTNAAGSTDCAILSNSANGCTSIFILGGYIEHGAGFNANGSNVISVSGTASNAVTGVVIRDLEVQTSKQIVNVVNAYVLNDITIKDNAFNAAGSYSGYAITVPANFIPNAYGNKGSIADINRVWTPVLQFGGAAASMTGTFLGYYYRRDADVDIQFSITLTSKGVSTGNATIAGLPTSSNASTLANNAIVNNALNMLSLAVSPIVGSWAASASGFYLYQFGATGTAVLTNSNFTNTSTLLGYGSYQM